MSKGRGIELSQWQNEFLRILSSESRPLLVDLRLTPLRMLFSKSRPLVEDLRLTPSLALTCQCISIGNILKAISIFGSE